MKVRAILMLGAMTMAGASMAQQPWEIATQLDLVPTPQEITLDGEQLDLDGFTIVTSRESEMISAAVGEINERVAALGGTALPVMAEAPGAGGLIAVSVAGDPYVNAVAEALGVTISEEDPGPQGYVIETLAYQGRPIIACVGSDELGALYAAVTLRHLIRERDGRVVALAASVRDWPDFRWRCNGRAGLRELQRGINPDDPEQVRQRVEGLKREIDRALRMKVNHLHMRVYGFAENEAIAAAQKEIVDYAAARGIHGRDVSGTTIGEYLTEEQRQQAFEPRQGRIYMWSALDAHRSKARDIAQSFAQTKTGISAIHPVDGGAYVDPEVWSRRPEPDRERYGDDRAAASIEQFQIYFDAFREIVPEMLCEAVVYPYHYQFALPDFPERYTEMNVSPYRNWWRAIQSADHAREVQAKLIDYHSRLAEALDDDIIITFREADREVFLACAGLYPGHRIDIWTYPEAYDGWHGTFFPQARYARSFVREDHDDYFFMASGTSNARDPSAQYMAHAEYLWNTDVPDGAADFTVESRLYAVGGQVTDYQRESLIPRIARRLYGEAAEVLGEVIAANISYNYVAAPADVMSSRGEDDENTFAHMADQAVKMEALFPRLADLLDRIEAGEVAGPDSSDIREDPAFGWALFYYKYTGLGAVKARLDAEAARARELLEAGERQQAAEVARAALNTIDEMAQRVASIHQRVEEIGAPVAGSGPALQTLDTFAPVEFAGTLNAVIEEAGAEG